MAAPQNTTASLTSTTDRSVEQKAPLGNFRPRISPFPVNVRTSRQRQERAFPGAGSSSTSTTVLGYASSATILTVSASTSWCNTASSSSTLPVSVSSRAVTLRCAGSTRTACDEEMMACFLKAVVLHRSDAVRHSSPLRHG